VPGTRAGDYLEALKLRHAGDEATVASVLDSRSVLFRRLWQPLAVATLNTGPEQASARLFWEVLAETLARGGAACRPLLPLEGLSESFIDPALAWLAARGAEIRFGTRLRAFGFSGERVSDLLFDGAALPLGGDDQIVLAVPAAVAARLVPGLVVPDDHAPIVNAHFRYASGTSMPPFVGVLGGTAEWIFRKRETVSVTVSAADRIVDRPAEELRDLLWRDVARAYGAMPVPVPPARIVKERRATFRASPAQVKRRPSFRTNWWNLRLAGDYVDTGLPATIEGAIRSGFAAAQPWCRSKRTVPGQNVDGQPALSDQGTNRYWQRALR
jgi:squalene-associated FAD-dependent desaturase